MIRLFLTCLSLITCFTALPLPPSLSPALASMAEGKAALRQGDLFNAHGHFITEGNKGNPQAQLYLGWMYYNGKGVKRNFKTSFSWYEAAAKNGMLEAWNALGLMYERGLGVSKDGKKAT